MNNADFALILLAAMLHAGWNFFAKKSVANKIATLWVGWLIAGSAMLPYAIYITDFSTFSISWIPYLFLTGIFHAAYLYSLGNSYSLGEMSIIYPISRGIGIFLTICIVLAFEIDTISADGLLGVMILVFGILSVALRRIRDLEKRAVMISAAKVGVFVSLYSVVDKLSVVIIPPVFYITSMFLITAFMMFPLMFYRLNSQMTSVLKRHKFYSGAIGIVSLLTYLMILFALKNSPASYVVALREISIVFGSILGIWLLKEEPSKRKMIGIVFIMIGAYVIKTS